MSLWFQYEYYLDLMLILKYSFHSHNYILNTPNPQLNQKKIMTALLLIFVGCNMCVCVSYCISKHFQLRSDETKRSFNFVLQIQFFKVGPWISQLNSIYNTHFFTCKYKFSISKFSLTDRSIQVQDEGISSLSKGTVWVF